MRISAFSTVALFVFAMAHAAFATPIVDVRASWEVDYPGNGPPLTSGIAITCLGNVTTEINGCLGNASLDQSVISSMQLSSTENGTVVVTNTTNQALSGLIFLATNFSAFNPGGPDIGVSIDNPIAQAGSYSSSVSGPSVNDAHGCAVGFNGDIASVGNAIFSPTTCGVIAPDSSDGLLSINLANLGPGQSDDFTYNINIAASFDIPEISSLPIMLTALLGFGLFGIGRRYRQWRKFGVQLRRTSNRAWLWPEKIAPFFRHDRRRPPPFEAAALRRPRHLVDAVVDQNVLNRLKNLPVGQSSFAEASISHRFLLLGGLWPRSSMRLAAGATPCTAQAGASYLHFRT